jgi:hypothetical protein
VNVRASSEDRDIVITLSQDDIALVRQRTTSNGASFLLISGLTLGKKPATDSVMLIPDTLTVQAVSTAIEMKILLRPNYIPNELKDSVLKGDFWRVGTDDTQYKVDHVKPDLDDPTDPRLTLFLDTQPRNAAKLSVTIPDPTAKDGKRKEVATTDYVKAPKATDSDPSGGADVYLSFLYSHSTAAGVSTDVYATDFSIHYPFWPGQGGSQFVTYLNPSVKGSIASKGQDDNNSVIFNMPFQVDALKRKPVWWLESGRLALGPTFESDKKFENRNLVFSATATLLPGDWKFRGVKQGRIRFYPYAGTELGKNIHNQYVAANGGTIRRLKTGGDAAIYFKIGKPALDTLTFTGSFVYRRLFSPESRVDTRTTTLPGGTLLASDGTQTTLPAGTLSSLDVFRVESGIRRDWKVQVIAGLTSNIALTVQYEKGSIPPQFKSVDKFQVGLAYRFAFGGATK